MANASQVQKALSSVTSAHPSGLTPHIILVAALLYMMSTDGDLAPEEIARLQESVGNDKNAIPTARKYIKKNKFDNFLRDSGDILDKPSKLCILANVYECMLSDGVVQKAETKLFQKIQKEYGFNDKTFEKISSVILTKNDNAVLGDYRLTASVKNTLTPHMVLAASILYMMSADGEVSEEEIGQLSAVINPYEGLQVAAMAYVEKVKLHEFIAAAQKSLNAQQKIYVLLNLCDSMLADGFAEPREVEIFNQFLEVFGYTEHAFKPYYSVIHIKNVKPFESKDSDLEESHGLFKNIINDDNGGFTVAGSGGQSASDKQMHERVIQDDKDGEKIRRTMEENAKNVKDGFGSSEHISVVSDNALSTKKQDFINQETSDLNIQKASAGDGLENVQKVSSGEPDDNVQKLDNGSSSLNVQTISNNSADENTQKIKPSTEASNVQVIDESKSLNNAQSLGSSQSTGNKQTIGIEGSKDNTQSLAIDARADNTQSLAIDARANNTQSIAIDARADNTQSIAIDARADNTQSIDSSSTTDNLAKLSKAANSDNEVQITSEKSTTNLQSIDESKDALNTQKINKGASLDNVQSLAPSATDQNNQSLASKALGANKASIQASTAEINIQPSDKKQTAENTLTLDPSKDANNKIKLSGRLNLDNKSNQLKDQFKDNSFGEQNHVLSNLVKETENASPLERLKHLGSQLESVNKKLNQVEKTDRALPIPMEQIVNRLNEQLKQKDEQNNAKLSSSSIGSSKTALSNSPLTDDNFLEDAIQLADREVNIPHPAMDEDAFFEGSPSFEDALATESMDLAANDFQGDFVSEPTDDFMAGFEMDLKDDFHDDFMTDTMNEFAAELRGDTKDDSKTHVTDQLKSALLTNSSSHHPSPLESGLFAQVQTTAPTDEDALATNTALDAKSLSMLDSSLLLLQIKNAKNTTVGVVEQHKKIAPSNLIYKSLKFSVVFVLFFSWHAFNEVSCDMVSCSWSQQGSPVRLDLEPEVFPTHSVRLLKVALTKKLNDQA